MPFMSLTPPTFHRPIVSLKPALCSKSARMLFTSRVSQSPIGPYRATAAVLLLNQSATAVRSVLSVCLHARK